MKQPKTAGWWFFATACIVLLALCGCAGAAARQYEEAHERYLEALDRVTVLEAEVAKAKLEGDDRLAAVKEEAVAAAKRAAEDAGKVRAETRDDATAEAEASRGFWSAIIAMSMIALNAGASWVGSAGKAVA